MTIDKTKKGAQIAPLMFEGGTKINQEEIPINLCKINIADTMPNNITNTNNHLCF